MKIIVCLVVCLFASAVPDRLSAVEVSEVSVGFDAGQMVGDPSGDTVYLIDGSTPRLYAIDTASGATRVRARLVDGSGTVILASSLDEACLALSQDRQHLFVSLPSAQRIQRYAVSDLHLEAETDLGFTPSSFVVAANGYFCIAHYVGFQGVISTVDPLSGAIIASVGGFYSPPLVRIGDSGTRVYGMQLGLSGTDEQVPAFEIGAEGSLTGVSSCTVPCSNAMDFAVSEADQRLYPMNGGVYGLTIVNMATNTSAFASFDISPYGYGVAQVPGGALVWASSYSVISAFRRSDNGRLFDVPVEAASMTGQNLAMAGNGRVVYRTSARRIGLIGSRSLMVEPDSPAAQLSMVYTEVPNQVSFSAVDSTGGSSAIVAHAWSIDGVSASTADHFNRTFTSLGTHVVRLSITNALGQNSISSRAFSVPFVAIEPSSGSVAGGTTVTITGNSLAGATGVTFGGIAATGVRVVSATAITCVAPAHAAATVDVVVEHPAGDITGADGYAFADPGVAPPAPPAATSSDSPNGRSCGAGSLAILGASLLLLSVRRRR